MKTELIFVDSGRAHYGMLLNASSGDAFPSLYMTMCSYFILVKEMENNLVNLSLLACSLCVSR